MIRQNEGRDTTSVAQAFYEGPASQNGRRIFYFVVSETALVDYDLLAYHIFTVSAFSFVLGDFSDRIQTVETAVDSFDLVIDLTEYSPAVDLPKFWLQRIAQMAPSSLLSLVNVSYSFLDLIRWLTSRPSHSTMPTRTPRNEFDGLYRIWSLSVRLPFRLTSQSTDPIGGPVGQHLVTACSPSELAVAIPFTKLYLPTYTMALAYEADHVFTNLLRMSDHDSHVPVVVKLGVDSMQVASVSNTGGGLVGSKLICLSGESWT